MFGVFLRRPDDGPNAMTLSPLSFFTAHPQMYTPLRPLHRLAVSKKLQTFRVIVNYSNFLKFSNVYNNKFNKS